LNSKEVISSGLLESYVLGTASPEEVQLIHALSKEHPEILKEIEAIEQGLLNFSAQVSPRLQEGMKEKIAAQLDFSKEESPVAKVISIKNETEGRLNIYNLGMAASLLLFLTSLLYNVQLNSKLSAMNREMAELTAEKTYMAEQLNIQQTSLVTLNMELEILANPMVKTIALKGMNTLENRSAMVHWDTQSNAVYFNAAVLPPAPESRQYQLWAIVDGKPVDAGMIDMNSTASVFQKMKSIKGAQAFAVTIETMGGSAVPTMETMCLLGNV
jgi:anti-sigma-K factor RskA